MHPNWQIILQHLNNKSDWEKRKEGLEMIDELIAQNTDLESMQLLMENIEVGT